MAQTVQKGKRRQPDDDDNSSPRPAAKRPRQSTARKSTGSAAPAPRVQPRASGSGGGRGGGGGGGRADQGQDGDRRRTYACLLEVFLLTLSLYSRASLPTRHCCATRDPQVPKEHGSAYSQAPLFPRRTRVYLLGLCGNAISHCFSS